MKKKISDDTDKNQTEYPLSLSDLQQFIDTAYPFFEAKWENAKANERRWLGKNFSEDQEKMIREQDRQPYSMAMARTKLQKISGIQRSQRTEVKISAASDPNDEVKAELAKLQVHSVERRSQFADIESEIFDSGLAILMGVSKIDLDYSDVYPRVKVKKLDYKDFMFDPNSKCYDINEDALWTCEIDQQYRKMINAKYGTPEKWTRTVSEGSLMSFQGRDKIKYYVRPAKSDRTDYDIVALFNFYIKWPRKVWHVIFPDSEQIAGITNVIESKHDTREAAEARLRELQMQYLMKGLPIEGEVEDQNIVGLDRYLFTYDRILEYEPTDLEMFPQNTYFSVRFEDEFISYMDILKDPQLWYDRFVMQIDYAMGKDNKIASQLNVQNLADSETPSSAVQKIQDGETILVKSNEEVLRYVQSKGTNSQWLGMMQVLSGAMEDLGGGQQFQGGANKSDSGKKVDSLIAQGSLIAKPFLDNLRRWKRSVFRNVLWWLEHYEKSQDVIKVQGGALTPEMIQLLQENNLYKSSVQEPTAGYVTINQEGNELSYLKNFSYELEISEEAMSDNEKGGKLVIALNQQQINPMLGQSKAWLEYLLSLQDLPKDVRFKIMQELEGAKEQAEQQKKKVEQMAMDKMNVEKAKVVAHAPRGAFGG